MKIRMPLLYVLLIVGHCEKMQAQTKDTMEVRWKEFIDLDQYSRPFWKTDTIFDETVQAIDEQGAISAKLLFKARAILSVKTANYSNTYLKGRDWDLKQGKLLILRGSAIPVLKKEDLVFSTVKQDYSMTGKKPGTYVLFTEKPYFSGLQIAVTYIKARGENWRGVVPVVSETSLPGTQSKLKNSEKLKIVFYGNSIEAGNNTSGHMNAAPFMPTWPELIVFNLRRIYGEQIEFSNQSVSGKLASWGLEQVDSTVVPENPDLVVIGFGMNDGSGQVPPETFRNNIGGIMQHVLARNPKAEFILIAPMLPNPDAVQSGIQSSYKTELDKLSGKGVVVADMTAVHAELLKHKIYQDMTGNNVNHPNDYLARWYAQIILGSLR